LLTGHKVQTVQEAGWSSLSNGKLLRAASDAGFEALVTLDQSIPFQQNVALLPLGVVVIAAPSNRFADLEPLIPATLEALASIRPGTVLRVGAY
jgi:hypothetical protein